MPLAAMWDTDSFTITDDGGHSLTQFATINDPTVPASGGDPAMHRRYWDYRLNNALPGGGSFNVTFTVLLKNTSNNSSKFWRVRPVSNFMLGTSGAVDSDSENNFDTSEQYVRFNHL